ncbi:hypothetical protein OBBRIDRAFT_592790 [Obba rivulosa]|uniref:Uncharacterized protein n=1 Tax=Obba rivulosa TaxID=1052685 RepID=A0A8E2ATX2_9APHY|nr:hypothetical protein OBBRIDRAFT_592790 [Obba rivulosa]
MTSVGVAASRRIAHLTRTQSAPLTLVNSAVLHVQTCTRFSGGSTQYAGERWSSTAAAQSRSRQLESLWSQQEMSDVTLLTKSRAVLDERHEEDEAVQSASVQKGGKKKDKQTGKKSRAALYGNRPEGYLTLRRTLGAPQLCWRAKPVHPTDPIRSLIMTALEFRRAADDFVALVDDASLRFPHPSNAPFLIKLIHENRPSNHLRVLLRWRGMHMLADTLAETRPLYALHAMTLTRYGQGVEQPKHWVRVATHFVTYDHWALLPDLVELQLRCTGRSLHFALNKLLEHCLRQGSREDPDEVMKLFRMAGVAPNAATHKLLRKHEALDPDIPSSGFIPRLLDAAAPPPSKKLHGRLAAEIAKRVGLTPTTTAVFVSTIHDPPSPPRAAHAAELIPLLQSTSRGRDIYELLKNPKGAARLAGRLINVDLPLHALHVLNISYHLMESPQPGIFDRAVKVLVECRCWEWYMQDQATVDMLNWLLQSYIERKIAKSPEDMLGMYRRAGLRPDNTTNALLEQLAAISRENSDSETAQ